MRVPVYPLYRLLAGLGVISFLLAVAGVALHACSQDDKKNPLIGIVGPAADVRICASDCQLPSPIVRFSSVAGDTAGDRTGDPMNLVFYSPTANPDFIERVAGRLRSSGWQDNQCGTRSGGPLAFATTSIDGAFQEIDPYPKNLLADGLRLPEQFGTFLTPCLAQYHVRLYKVSDHWVLGSAHREIQTCGLAGLADCPTGRQCGGFHCVTSWEQGEAKVFEAFRFWVSCKLKISGFGYPPIIFRPEVPPPDLADNVISVVGLRCTVSRDDLLDDLFK